MGIISAVINFIASFLLVLSLSRDGGDTVLIVLAIIAVAVVNYVHGLEDARP